MNGWIKGYTGIYRVVYKTHMNSCEKFFLA